MLQPLINIYKSLVIQRPLIGLILTLLVLSIPAWHVKDFKLDASSDSLVLENDRDLEYYRQIREQYGSDDYLVITYRPKQNLFATETLNDIQALRDKLKALDRVESVTTILDVPLVNSPQIGFREILNDTPYLLSKRTDLELAKQELSQGPLYSDLLVSKDMKTTALMVLFKPDKHFNELLNTRNKLRDTRLRRALSVEEKTTLKKVSEEYNALKAINQHQQQLDIASVREIVAGHMDRAAIHLGGIPMIVSDIIDYVNYDIEVFGLGVLLFLVVLLSISFRRLRWVILPMLVCAGAVVGMIGLLGMLDWRVTVVSSNFISLMLIITLALIVHLVVRYREVYSLHPEYDQQTLVWETVRSKVEPAFFTAITTVVAFGSLLVSGIRPVIDFGWMMVMGVSIAFVLSFVLFPAVLVLMKPVSSNHAKDFTARMTTGIANLISNHHRGIIIGYVLLGIASIAGMTLLTVENRFIDYFKQDTAIYQGMITIDRDLGGTTPLDVVLDPDDEFMAFLKEMQEEGVDEESAGISGSSYWFDTFALERVEKIQEYLDSLPQTGKVLSMATSMKLMKILNNNEPLENIHIAVMYKRLPKDVKDTLFTPYMSDDGNQVRFSIRVFESDKTLQRQELLDKIRTDLKEKFELKDEQIHLTGMVVLYNNMLQSLFESQILTLGVVFLAIMMMFIVLFRSFRIAAIAIVPNLVAAGFVLGAMGVLGIHLDIMTITIAAITIGIAVDDTIHYVHRYLEEYEVDQDPWATVRRCHSSIGRAMYYTTMTITLGFSILVLSSFVPTIYFGLLTGLAMVIALAADMMLLPVMLVYFSPLRKRGTKQEG